MYKKTRMAWFIAALLVVLLLSTGSAAARRGGTPFEGIAYICAMDPALRSWATDDEVLHERGIVIRSDIQSAELMMTGGNIDLAHRDIDLSTLAVRVWGTGTIVTEEGTWYHVWTARTNADGLLVSHAHGYGKDGLEGYVFQWRGEQLAEFPDDAPCGDGVALAVTGFISGGFRR